MIVDDKFLYEIFVLTPYWKYLMEKLHIYSVCGELYKMINSAEFGNFQFLNL